MGLKVQTDPLSPVGSDTGSDRAMSSDSDDIVARLLKDVGYYDSGAPDDEIANVMRAAAVGIERLRAEIVGLRDLVHLCSGFLDPDSRDAHVRAAVKRVIREMTVEVDDG